MSTSPVALISGAGRGIGRAAALELAGRGYRLALVARTRGQLLETQRLIGAESASMMRDADLRAATACGQVVESALEHFGRIDALVHCAGYAPVSAAESMSDADWNDVLAVNLSAAFFLARAVWPAFKRQGGGVIVNISSPAAQDPFAGFAAYGAAKAGLNTLSLVLAREGAAHNIRVHTISPGATETEMFRALMTPEQYPPERTLAPADVARVIGLCVGGELRHTSGQVIGLSRRA
jgi:NAD(P)-dependent dehydrogenase (short-subunit alcohol dehydrogenase family)